MKRRHFLYGTGAAAVGGSSIVGSGAFSGVVSKRTASVRVAHDSQAYLGLKRPKKSPNRSYVDYDDKGHLRIRMDPDNPTEDGGKGVNSDSFSWFNNLFKICNQGKQDVYLFLWKKGKYADRVVFYDDQGPCWNRKLKLGDCVKIGMATYTHGIPTDTQLLDNVYIMALGAEEYNPTSTAEEEAPDDSIPNDEYEGPTP